MRRFLIALLIAGIPSFVAPRDSINAGSTAYKDVYVVNAASGYYISLPDSGTVVNVPTSEVDAQRHQREATKQQQPLNARAKSSRPTKPGKGACNTAVMADSLEIF